jgi:hypothetical protein
MQAGWRLEVRLTLLNWTLLYNRFARTTQKTQPLFCWEGVYTAPLHNNGSYSIVACVFVATGMCLPSRCLEIDIYADFTVPAFGRYIVCGELENWEKMSRACSLEGTEALGSITGVPETIDPPPPNTIEPHYRLRKPLRFQFGKFLKCHWSVTTTN